MKILMTLKTHKTKEGKEFKKYHYYLEFDNGVRTQILPYNFKDKNGNYNNRSEMLLKLVAFKID